MTTVDTVETTERIIRATQTLINTAQWNLNYVDWLAKIDAVDDDYWRDKWHEFQELSRALDYFDAHTLARICYQSGTQIRLTDSD